MQSSALDSKKGHAYPKNKIPKYGLVIVKAYIIYHISHTQYLIDNDPIFGSNIIDQYYCIDQYS